MTTPAAVPPYAVQITLDCARPHELAEWWAQVLGWEVEPQDESFIRSMIEQGHATEADTATHRGRLVWREGVALQAPEGSPQRVRWYLQAVPEGKAVKNRMHLDLRPPGGDGVREAHRQRLRDLGAREVGGGRQGAYTWTVWADPEGNEFCL
ncbi:MAG: VOC family protein [Kineosporiaceae bacterium]